MASKPRSFSTGCVCISHWHEGALPSTNRKRVFGKLGWDGSKMEYSFFFDYYKNNIHPDITSIAWWAIPCGVYDPYSGVTNNQAEGLNYMLKQLQEWKEVPVDCMILALQGYYRVEIARGHQGLGNYHLHPEYTPCTFMLRQLTCWLRGTRAENSWFNCRGWI